MEVRWISASGVRTVTADDVAGVANSADGLLWVDLDHSESDGMALLSDVFKFELETIDECHVRTPVPKLRRFPGYTFTAINGVARGDDGVLHFQPLKVFSTPTQIVTVLGPTHQALSTDAAHREISHIAEQVDSGVYQPTSAKAVGVAIRKAMLVSQQDLVAGAASQIVQIERGVMECDPVKGEDLLVDLFAVRHDLQTIRTSAAQTRASFSPLPPTQQSTVSAATSRSYVTDSSTSRTPPIWSASTSKRCSIYSRRERRRN